MGCLVKKNRDQIVEAHMPDAHYCLFMKLRLSWQTQGQPAG